MDSKSGKDEIQLWMFLCNKMNRSENTISQIRKHAEDVGIDDVKNKNRATLCRDLAKNYYLKLKSENGGDFKTLPVDSKSTGSDHILDKDSTNNNNLINDRREEDVKKISSSLKVKLAKLIDNSEGEYRNYFDPQDIDNWEQGKSLYDYHEVLYNVKNLNIIKQNKRNLSELYQFQDFPTFTELLKLLINSIEGIPIKDRQKYVMSLKAIFMNDRDENKNFEEEEKFFEYDYEEEYGVRR